MRGVQRAMSSPVRTPRCRVPLTSSTSCVRQKRSIASATKPCDQDLRALLDLGDAIAAGAFGLVKDPPIGCRQCRVGEQRARRRHRAVRQINRGRTRPMRAKHLGHHGDGRGGALDQRMAALRVADRRREDVGEPQRAVVAQDQHPGLERAGHAGGKEPGAGHEVEPFLAVMRNRCAGRRRPLAADHFGFAALHIVENHRHVAAGAVEMRLDHLQRERRRHGGVEGIAALLQRRHADRRGDPVRGRDDAERALDFWPRGERIWTDVAHRPLCNPRWPRAKRGNIQAVWVLVHSTR